MGIIRVLFTVRQERKILKIMGVRKSKSEDERRYDNRKRGIESEVAKSLFIIGFEKLIQAPVDYTRTYTLSNMRLNTFYKNSQRYVDRYGDDDSKEKVEFNVVDKNSGVIEKNVKFKKEFDVSIDIEDKIIDYLIKIYIDKNHKISGINDIILDRKQEDLDVLCTKIIRYEASILLESYEKDKTIKMVLENHKLYKLRDKIDITRIKTATIYEDIRRINDPNRSRDTKREVFRRLKGEYPLLVDKKLYLEDMIKQVYTTVPKNMSSTVAYTNYVYEECLKQLNEQNIINSDK